MHPIGALFTLIVCVLQLALPWRLAAAPILLTAGFMTRGQVLDIGPIHLSVMRLVVIFGLIRILTRGERIEGGLKRIDWLVLLWAAILIMTSVLHTSDAWVYRIGIVWNDLGCYFLLRVFIRDWKDVKRVGLLTGIIMIPAALEMIQELVTTNDLFGFLGGIAPEAEIRSGRVRAHGPFAHAILAGSAAAACFPMALLCWKKHKLYALAGTFSGLGIVYASGSSGPVMSVAIMLGAMSLWMVRKQLRLIFWSGVFLLIALDIYMKDPVYFVLAKIDITGGSTGWHRAELIRSALAHSSEWLLSGTDYTRHWMPTGIHANEIHTDITNHYLQMGVWGGLPLMIVYISIIWTAFRTVGNSLRRNQTAPVEKQFLIWTLGAVLLGHTVSIISISYFDASVVFLYLALANIACFQDEPAVAPHQVAPVRKGRFATIRNEVLVR